MRTTDMARKEADADVEEGPAVAEEAAQLEQLLSSVNGAVPPDSSLKLEASP